MQKAVVVKAFGEGVVWAVPVTGKFDHNADAEELGSTVVHSAHMTGGFRKLQQQVPTATAVAKEVMQRRAEVAAEASLGWGDVIALGLTADRPGAPEATKGIKRFGLEAVLARTHFAQWFGEAMVECRYREFRSVPVKVAYLENIAATWSLGGTLTLSLAFDEDHRAGTCPARGGTGGDRAWGGAALLHRRLPSGVGRTADSGRPHRGRSRRRLRPQLEWTGEATSS